MDNSARGRGAWPSSGTGGTLNSAGTKPGPFYVLAANASDRIGARVIGREHSELSLNDYAVYQGVIAIQRLANLHTKTGIHPDGDFGPATDAAVRAAQAHFGLKTDGVVGRVTMRSMLTPVIYKTALAHDEPWEPLFGILHYEGNWDPGAVGFIDNQDVGLAQINRLAHPHVSLSQAYDPFYAVEFVAKYFRNSLNHLNNNVRDAVASYNLGIGGARQWISAGRPDRWTPPWSPDRERNVKGYIDGILGAADDVRHLVPADPVVEPDPVIEPDPEPIDETDEWEVFWMELTDDEKRLAKEFFGYLAGEHGVANGASFARQFLIFNRSERSPMKRAVKWVEENKDRLATWNK
jgi:peptidoglycan hydrolase-like protein with peptidoglycan-binding domain